MYHLATVFPPVQRFRRLPLSRDQLVLLMIAINQIFLGIDTFLAHGANQTIRPNEWVPILFGPVAGGLLLLAGLIALRRRSLATVIASLTLLASIIVGLLGAYLHLERGILPTAPLGERISVDLLVWAPPILGPLIFSLVGILGISAAWIEDPPDSGILVVWGGRRLQLPYAKTQAYFYIVGLAALATVISSVLDHARLNFADPWLWLPAVAGIFSTVAAVMLGTIDRPTRADLIIYTGAMLLLMGVGVIGAVLHVEANLIAQGTIVPERFLQGAPVLAPLLFANVGLLGLIVLLDPREHHTSE
ncbi:MAG TPA: hypothetical protein VGD99_06115 [Anaerolineae bacterium]|jgi:hypothetical protein